MYCPVCGQQQVSAEMKFCSRCGRSLSGLAEWLSGGLPAGAVEAPAPRSRRRKGIRRGAKLMFLGGMLFPVGLIISFIVDDGGPMFFPIMFLFVGLLLMLYARLFSDDTAPPLKS